MNPETSPGRRLRVAFNALSVSNASGAHVLFGHLRQVLRATDGTVEHVLVVRGEQRAAVREFERCMAVVSLPNLARSWLLRRPLEAALLPGLLRRFGVDVLFQPDGGIVPGLELPQWVLAQNPWCFFEELQTTRLQRIKAAAQRRAYAAAQRGAAVMFYNSGHMRDLYERNAGRSAVRAELLHQGVDESRFDRGEHAPGFEARRCDVLAVSAMAPHKSIEDLLDALPGVVHSVPEARLVLVGAWPDDAYRCTILARAEALGLSERVVLVGHVSDAELLEHYSRARVFCLLSRCESFGIPAVEAQACGTPTVVSEGTAAPEIAGPGGEVVAAGDPVAAAAALTRLLSDPDWWARHSARARANAARFHWAECSRPLAQRIGGRA